MDSLVFAYFVARWGGLYKRPVNPVRPFIRTSRLPREAYGSRVNA